MPRGIYKRNPRPLADRFNEKVDRSGPCWNWTGSRRDGYGQLRVGRSIKLATHVAWFLVHGTWPKLHVCHTCDTPSCVRINHLFLGTDADNLRDMAAKGRHVGFRKLTADQTAQIRSLAGTATHRELARRFGVTYRTIGRVLDGTSWKQKQCSTG